jgi:hypothetical protein
LQVSVRRYLSLGGFWDPIFLSHSALVGVLLGWFRPTILVMPLQELALRSLAQENVSHSVFVLDYHVPYFQ